MSIDVFGRVLDSKARGARGPPGEGFKRTFDSHYDIQNKRLCNVATPKDDFDAVNLGILRQVMQIKTSPDNEIHEVKGMVESLNNTFLDTMRQWDANLEGIKALIERNAELITLLATKLSGHVRTGKNSFGGRAPQSSPS